MDRLTRLLLLLSLLVVSGCATPPPQTYAWQMALQQVQDRDGFYWDMRPTLGMVRPEPIPQFVNPAPQGWHYIYASSAPLADLLARGCHAKKTGTKMMVLCKETP